MFEPNPTHHSPQKIGPNPTTAIYLLTFFIAILPYEP